MKVYQINVVCGSGSTGRIAADLSRLLQKHGGECRIAYGRGNCLSDEIDSIRISSEAEVYFHACLTRMTDRHGLYSKKATRRLIEDIKKYSPDIIHLHNLHGYYLNYEILFRFLKSYHSQVLWTMHDCWAFTGHCAHYDAAGCEKWRKGCQSCPNLHGYPSSFYGGNVGANYKRKKEYFTSISELIIVTPSNWLKGQIQKSFLKNSECITIPNGVDLSQFKPQESALRKSLRCEGKKLLLGVASVWTRNKGLDDFVQLREMLGTEYVICLIGVTEKQIRNLPVGIIGKTRVDGIKEMAQYYSAADVFLNLTYEDTFPTTNIEALACGTPVLTYRTGGSPEIISEECGVAVDAGDLNAVVFALENEIKEKECYWNDCLRRAKQFNKEKCYEKYIDLYMKAVGEIINE